MLTETERQFYLAAAGIRLWYARGPLPGAAPSPEFEFLPELSPPPVPVTVASPLPSEARPDASAPAPAGPRPNLRALIAGAADKPAAAGAPEAKVQAQEASATEAAVSRTDAAAGVIAGVAADVPPVILQVWAGRRFALVAEVSADTSMKLLQSLARNILISVGEREAECYGPAHWPVFNNRAVAGSRPEDLLVIVRDLLAPVAGHSLLLLGVADMDGNGDTRGWLSRVGEYDAALMFPHSLAELAAQPALKRSLWQQLKALVVT